MCQPLGIEPLIRRMNKSPHLLKRRAVVSALIKWRVSAEEEQLKLSGRRRAGSDGSSHSLQLGLVGPHTMARGAASRRQCSEPPCSWGCRAGVCQQAGHSSAKGQVDPGQSWGCCWKMGDLRGVKAMQAMPGPNRPTVLILQLLCSQTS